MLVEGSSNDFFSLLSSSRAENDFALTEEEEGRFLSLAAPPLEQAKPQTFLKELLRVEV